MFLQLEVAVPAVVFSGQITNDTGFKVELRANVVGK